MFESREPLHISFNKGYTLNGFAPPVYHLHLHRLGDHDELYFRDLLRADQAIRTEYAALKHSLAAPFRHDRDGYTQAKTDFITTHTAEARRRFPASYLP
jgi:GrpB-like predicted nucleotidyltransferase (UPF0157 family)